MSISNVVSEVNSARLLGVVGLARDVVAIGLAGLKELRQALRRHVALNGLVDRALAPIGLEALPQARFDGTRRFRVWQVERDAADIGREGRAQTRPIDLAGQISAIAMVNRLPD
jgi:hypothetical protein